MKILITGAAGFIGSNMLECLNEANYKDIVLVDDFSRPEKERNYSDKIFSKKGFTWCEALFLYPDLPNQNHFPRLSVSLFFFKRYKVNPCF